MGETVASPPRVDRDLLIRLHADLIDAGYTVDGVRAVLGPVADAALHREQALPADLVTRTNSEPAAVLIRCFALGMPVPGSRLRAALPAVGLEGLAGLRLIETSGDEVRATCDLRPYGDETHDWWLASDLSEIARGAPLPEDHVLGAGPASATVAQWTPRRRVRRALDLGTGCGVQALHLTGHAQDVIATDLSERALAYARFNVELAGVDVDLRRGNLLEPVAGELFDLIVSNPPFVISPHRPGLPSFEYRDAGLVGDELVPRLVRGVGDHLTPGGAAIFIGNWETSHGQSWREPWAAWLDGTGLDAYVVQRDEQDPAEYAELWASDAGSRSGVAGFEELYASWLDDFAARGVERIGFGVFVLQRPATGRRPWTDLVEHTGPVDAAMGPVVEARLRARTWLAEHTDEDLLATAWHVAEDVTEERHFRPGASDPEVIQLRQGGGLRRIVRLDTVGAGLVSVCDGTLSAGAALQAIAHLLDEPAEAVVSLALPLLKDLVTDGLLQRTSAH